LKIFSKIFQKYSKNISPKVVTKVVKKQIGVAHVILFTSKPFTCEEFSNAFSKYGFNFEIGD
jgi:hypothetical protein